MCDDVHIELEALRATYDGAVNVASSRPMSVMVALAPRGCPLALPAGAKETSTAPGDEPLADAEARCFVRATLLLTCGPEYPDRPPSIQLRQPRGAHCKQGRGRLGEAREAALLRRLRDEAEGLAGELVLGHLCEAAQDVLAELNAPDGDCPICLLPFAAAHERKDQSEDAAAGQPVKLHCYHCMHRSCFGNWWRWQKRHAGCRTGGQCPVCRAPVSTTALAHSSGTLSGANSEQQKADDGAWGGSRDVVEDDSNAWLAAEDMARLRVTQQRWAEGIAQQRLRDGLVKTGGWAVSIDELQQLQQDAQRAAQAVPPAAAAISTPGQSGASPATIAECTAPASSELSSERGRRGSGRHVSSRKGSEPQRGSPGPRAQLPGHHGRSPPSWRAGTRDYARGRGRAVPRCDGTAREQRTRNVGRAESANHQKEHTSHDGAHAKPARPLEQHVQGPQSGQ